ncbi:MAG TPA: hypothetical protein DGC76_10685, partial [Candidatus Accumulibacter sp.]|nr:hypothetical protein [Accumulibacter sp.]
MRGVELAHHLVEDLDQFLGDQTGWWLWNGPEVRELASPPAAGTTQLWPPCAKPADVCRLSDPGSMPQGGAVRRPEWVARSFGVASRRQLRATVTTGRQAGQVKALVDLADPLRHPVSLRDPRRRFRALADRLGVPRDDRPALTGGHRDTAMLCQLL